MEVGREDFEAGHHGNSLQLVMQCMPNDKAWTQDDIRAETGLDTKSLNKALKRLEELGRIEAKRLGPSMYFLKVMRASPQVWYTIDEAATYLRVSRRTVYQLIQQQQLPAFRVGHGGHHRFNREDLDTVVHGESDAGTDALTARDDPVLAELWDNAQDAEYDNL